MERSVIFVFLVTALIVSIIEESSAKSIRDTWGRARIQRGLTDEDLKGEFEEAFEAVREVEETNGRPLTEDDLEEVEELLEMDPKYRKFAHFIAKEYNSWKDTQKDSLVAKRSDATERVARYPELY